MKKFLIMLLALTLVFSFTSCKKSDNNSSEVSEEQKPFTLKIATYNIKNGYDVDHIFSVIADDLKKIDADIVGLQEVDMNTHRNGGQDTLAIIAEKTDYKYYKFTHCIDFSGGEYGTAILSKYPIESFETFELLLGEDPKDEQRALGHAVIDINGTKIDFFNTHLTLKNAGANEGVREKQFAFIGEKMQKCEKAILTADFNTETFSDFAPLGDVVLVNNDNNKLLSYNKEKAIDNIVVPVGSKVIESGLDVTGHSDHALLWAVVELPQ